MHSVWIAVVFKDVRKDVELSGAGSQQADIFGGVAK